MANIQYLVHISACKSARMGIAGFMKLESDIGIESEAHVII